MAPNPLTRAVLAGLLVGLAACGGKKDEAPEAVDLAAIRAKRDSVRRVTTQDSVVRARFKTCSDSVNAALAKAARGKKPAPAPAGMLPPELLKACVTRPWSTKQRISGRHGHLSNESVHELLSGFTQPRWRHVFLTHLSRDCNSLDAVEAMLSTLRKRLTCDFNVVAPGGGTSTFEW